MPYNLFVGRWSPFHSGHKYIIDSFLNNEKKVCIAVRETEVTEENPFSTELRKRLIERVYSGNPNVKIITIPDIEQVIVGRGVGYSIVEAPEDIQKISGTEIREHKLIKFNEGKGKVVWLTGLPGSGKTTLATLLKLGLRLKYDVEILDGDIFRRTFSKGLGFSSRDRLENIKRAMKVAKQLADYGLVVVCSFITPYRQIRNMLRKYLGDYYIEAYIKCSISECEKRDPKGLYKKARSGEIKEFTGISSVYQIPISPDIVIDTEFHSKEECLTKIKNGIIKEIGK